MAPKRDQFPFFSQFLSIVPDRLWSSSVVPTDPWRAMKQVCEQVGLPFPPPSPEQARAASRRAREELRAQRIQVIGR